MRRVIAVLSLMAIVTLAAGVAQAGFVTGDYYFLFNNWGNSGMPWNSPGGASRQLPGGPFATTDGVIWEKTGSTYQLNWQDVNIEIDFRTASNQPTTVITNTFLVSTNVAKGDVNYYTPPTPDGAYPGYWFGSGTVPDAQSPYAVGLGGNQEYYLPSTLTNPAVAQFDLYFWQGNETSYAAAATAGEYVGNTGWFPVGALASYDSPVPSTTFEYMPSVILAVPTPEPSTIALLAAGLFGLLAYAWRKRK